MKLLSGPQKGLKMSGLSLLLAGLVAGGLFFISSQGGRTMEMRRADHPVSAAIPPIDAGTSARTETATFGLG